MKQKLLKLSPLKIVSVLFLLTLLKTIALYKYTNITEIGITVIITIPFLVLVYSSITLINSRRRNLYLILLHIVISFILFADLVYYQYYNFMPSVKSLLLAGQAAGVGGSIIYFLEPIYFIMLADIVPIIVYLWKHRGEHVIISPKLRTINKYVSILMVVSIIFSIVSIEGSSSYVYGSHGIYAYHIYDTYYTLSDNEESVDDFNIDEIIKGERDTNNNEKSLFGAAKDRNLIVIQFESLQNFLINDVYEGQELTPNLNKLIQDDSIYYSHYYQQVGPGNTSDAEFVSNNSMYPSDGYSVYTQFTENDFYSLPIILKNKGYRTKAFHGFKGEFWNREEVYPHQGFEDFISQEDFGNDDLIGLGLSDKSFFKQTVEQLKNIEEPFYSFVVTLTTHHPYEIPEDTKSIELRDEHKETLFGNYINAIHYSDQALGSFIEGLREAGLYDNSMIVIYGDHFGLYPSHEDNKEIMTNYLGREYNYEDVFNIPFIIHIPGLGNEEEKTVAGGQIDFLPTILNLLGLEDEKGIFFGKDLNNIEEGFVALQYFLPEGSFLDNEKIFIMSNDGKFENSKAWDLKTKEPIDIETCREGYQRAIEEKRKSNYLLENNLLKEIIK